jgi:Arc/MetJ family transcription regulator
LESASNEPGLDWESLPMRTTLVLDDEQLERAQELTGLKEKSALVREALKALIEREAARRLARLGGSQPVVKAPPRRRAPRK